MSAEQLNEKLLTVSTRASLFLKTGRSPRVNAAIEKMTGMGRAELMRLSLSQLLDPAPPLYSQPSASGANAEHQKPLIYESSLTLAGGQSRAVAVSVHTVQEGEGGSISHRARYCRAEKNAAGPA
jgi:nitrogen-specific signal transduction histidine kinase